MVPSTDTALVSMMVEVEIPGIDDSKESVGAKTVVV